jgi:hypothetical protein
MRWSSSVAVSILVANGVFGCSDNSAPQFQAAAGGAGASSPGGSAGSNTAGGGSSSAGSAGAGSGGTAGVGGGAGSDGPSAGTGGGSADTGGAGTGTGGSAGMAGGAVVTVPAAPTGLALGVLGPDMIKLTWTDVATDETGYYVSWSTTGTMPATPNRFLDAGTTTATADGLTSGTPYTFWVQAHNAAGASTAVSGMATPGPVPMAPTALVITPSTTDLKLSWTDNATDEIGYRIYVSTTSTQPLTTTRTVAAGGTSYTIPAADVTPYTTYYVWVTAFNAIGDSPALTGSGAAGSAPLAPATVTVAYDPANKFAVTANWTDSSDNEGGFDVYWSTDDTKPATAGASVAANTATYKLSKVFGGATYRFWVEATNVVGRSVATLGTASVATTDLSWGELWVADDLGTHLALLVDPADPVTQLFAYYSADPANMGTPAVINPWKIYGKAELDMTKVGYFWTESRATEGSLFSLRTLTPSTATVTGVVVTPNDTGASLTWTPAVGYTGKYTVLWGTDTEATATIGATTATSSATVSGLLPGADYKFWVRAAGIGINTVNANNSNGFPGVATLATAKTTGVALGPNLAAGKATASSSGNAALAVDGNLGTRWESAFNDNEWMYVDLGATTSLTHAKMVWEAAYSKTLEIQVCSATCPTDDPLKPLPQDWAWQTVYVGADRMLSGFPNSELVALNAGASGRYVRMLGKTRATIYGHSMWEFQLFNATAAAP